MKKSLVGSAIAFLLATSCCWLPFFAVIFGGVTSLVSLNDGLQQYSGVFMFLGVLLLGYGLYQLSSQRKGKEVILESQITCPKCQYQKLEKMPTNACQFFYECANCKEVLKPNKGDCCVYCSYGTVECPPIQQNESCCV